MTAGPADDPREVARELRDVVSEIAAKLDKTAAYGRRTRRLSVALVVSVALDIALSVVLGFALLTLSRHSAEIHANQVRACHVGNDARAAQRALWDHVLTLSATPPRGESPAQRAARQRQLQGFRGYIAREFRAVGCPAL